jgi:peptide/nickel transport system permease protein
LGSTGGARWLAYNAQRDVVPQPLIFQDKPIECIQVALTRPFDEGRFVHRADHIIGRIFDRWVIIRTIPVRPDTSGWVDMLNDRRALTAVVHRLALALIALPVFVVFVALAAELRRGGGLESLGDAAPAALDIATSFAGQIASGELEVQPEVGEALVKSLGLVFVALLIGVPLGLALGFYAASRRHTGKSALISAGSVVGVSTPSYVVAMFMVWAVVWVFQSTGVRLLPVFGFGWEKRLILPALVLAARPLANMLSASNASIREAIDADYVRTAHSKGLPSWRIYWIHILRNVGVPLMAAVLVSVSMTISVLPIVEMIFAWPGIGLALLQTDDPASTVVLVLPLVIVIVLLDIGLEYANGIVDPRAHARSEAGH